MKRRRFGHDMLVAKQPLTKNEIALKKIAVPGTMTSAFLALQLWLEMPAGQFDFLVVPFDPTTLEQKVQQLLENPAPKATAKTR